VFAVQAHDTIGAELGKGWMGRWVDGMGKVEKMRKMRKMEKKSNKR
jgi:hypothetical protein